MVEDAGTSTPRDPLAAAVLTTIAAEPPRSPKKLLQLVGKRHRDLPAAIDDRLVEQARLGDRQRLVGVPISAPQPTDDAIADVRRQLAMLEDGSPDAQTIALARLVGSLDRWGAVFPDRARRRALRQAVDRHAELAPTTR